MPAADGIHGRRKGDALPTEDDFTVVGLEEPVEDVHQGGLAGTVLSHECSDFAVVDGEVDMIVGDDTREPLDDPLQRDNRFACLAVTRACRPHDPNGSSTSISPSMICCCRSLTCSMTSG